VARAELRAARRAGRLTLASKKGKDITMPSAVIVGAGLGGLSAAIRLAVEGWNVTVLEKNAEPGGRMSTVSAGGFTWDAGPTLIMMPEVLHDLFAAAGRRLSDYLDLRRVDPYYRVAYEDGSHLDLSGSLPAMVSGVNAIEPGAGPRFLRFLGEAESLSRCARRDIIERPFASAYDVCQPAVAYSLLRARPFDTVASVVRRHFRSDKLRQAFSFQTLYLGTRPEAAPAAYVMIPFVEAALGVWYPMGGVHRIAQAYARLATELGVTLRLGTPVERIVIERGRARGVSIGGDVVPADAVVANAEWGYTQERLLARGERTSGRDYGCSGVLFLLAVRRRVAGPHHTFLLSADFEGNLADLFARRRLPDSPSIYVSRPTATDPSLAPAGIELLYVLVPSPTLESGVDWAYELPGFRKRVLDRLALIGLDDVEDDIVAETTLTPATFASRYNLSRGSAFGLAATLVQSGPFRPAVRSRRHAGLYYAGASSHPGGGVPIVTLSGGMAAQAILKDHARASRRRWSPGARDLACAAPLEG
jgi:phytoene desaturase